MGLKSNLGDSGNISLDDLVLSLEHTVFGTAFVQKPFLSAVLKFCQQCGVMY